MRFRYLRDPLFAACVVLYFLNRFLLKRLVPDGFLHEHLNDLICIPFWVPIMLWGMRRVGLRREDGPPRGEEVLIPLLVWSYVFEVYLPKMHYFSHVATADYLDIFWYAVGACGAIGWWEWWYGGRRGEEAKGEEA